MEIQYLGLSGFIINTKKVKIVIDPLSKETGAHVEQLEADIVCVTRPTSPYFDVKSVKSHYLVNAPGEYEFGGVMIFGYAAPNGDEINILYEIHGDGVSLIHLGGIPPKPKNGMFTDLSSPDVLIVPVGNMFTTDSKEAVNIVTSINPLYVIPCMYSVKGLISPLKEGLKELGTFLESMNAKEAKPISKMKILEKQIKRNEEKSEVKTVVLSPMFF